MVHGAGGMGKTTAVVAYPAEGSPTAFDAVLFVAVGQTRQVRDFSGLPRLYRGQILVLWIYVIPTVNPKDSSRWIVCRSIQVFDKAMWSSHFGSRLNCAAVGFAISAHDGCTKLRRQLADRAGFRRLRQPRGIGTQRRSWAGRLAAALGSCALMCRLR